MARQKRSSRRRKSTSAEASATQKESGDLSSRETSSPQSVFALGEDKIEQYLVSGEAQGALEDYFGADALVQVQDLARQAAARTVRGGPRVFILPGIMGSTLGKTGDGVLWLDPVQIALGYLSRLRVDGHESSYRAKDVILFAYLKLKLRLKLAGFDADFFPFDWRLSLEDLGAALAKRVAEDSSPQISLVAHGMGGLVARAAWKAISRKVARLVMLGTPNYGSFAPVQVLRGAYDVVNRIALVDSEHDTAELVEQVFRTFPGLYQMLPAPAKFSTIDLYDPRSWPQEGSRPTASILRTVVPVIRKLADADSKFYLVAGMNRDTVVGLHSDKSDKSERNEFVYTISPEGDGTVPLAFAQLDGLPAGQTYYVDEDHGSLPNNDLVEAAVVDLLRSGSTSVLPSQRPQPSRQARTVRESELIRTAQRSTGISQLGASDYRTLIEPLAAPPRTRRDLAGAGAAGGSASSAARTQALPGITIGRQVRRRIEITLAHGSITEADAPAYALGVFRNVAPSGAARAVDERLGGAISEFTARRMFNGDLGSVFNVPVGRNRMAAGMVMFVGLGAFDQFTPDAQQLAAENIIRVLARSRIDEFATVLIGAGTGQSAAAVMEKLMTGFIRGLRDADPKLRFRGITLCETDSDRFSEMKAEMYRMAATSLFDDIELTLRETEIPAPAEAPGRVLQGREPVYLTVRQETQENAYVYNVSLLGSGLKAAIFSGKAVVRQDLFKALLREFDATVDPRRSPPADIAAIRDLGKRFAEALLPPQVASVLPQMDNRHVVVVHDSPSSRVPWEILTIPLRTDRSSQSRLQPSTGDWSPAIECGLSRLYAADHLPTATWMEQRRAAPKLSLLLVIDPSSNLPDALEEGTRIEQLAAGMADVDVTTLRQGEATRLAILNALGSGRYDCVHYAGHAFFDESAPGRSGLICANDEILAGSDLRGIANLPYLIFFNACEGARIRGVRTSAPEKSATEVILKTSSVAESLMRGGIANYLSTYWPVNDKAARIFAETFYTRVLKGQSLGSSLLDARQALDQKKLRDWANYVLTGTHDFVLKRPADGR
jgi:hypothetical protein